MIKNILILCLFVFLSACTVMSKYYEIAPRNQTFDTVPKAQIFTDNIAISDVTVDEMVKDKMTDPLTVEKYIQALTTALQQVKWYNNDNARFKLEAHFLEIHLPRFGFNFTVKAKASYKLTEKKTGKIYYDKTFTTPCTIPYFEEDIGENRARKAASCAIGDNINRVLKDLSEQYGAGN